MDSGRLTPLHLAAKNDCSVCVKAIYEAAVNSEQNFCSNLVQKDAEGQTPLVMALRYCKKVYDRGVASNNSQTSSTILASQEKNRGQVVETLLHLGSDPQQIWRANIRPIHLASERGNIHILAAVLLSLIEQTMNF